MKQPFLVLRLVLLLVCAFNLYFAYQFFFTPDVLSKIYGVMPGDSVQQYLTMTLGAFMSVFGLGALLAMLRPLQYGAIIIMLLLMHFMIFVIDVIVLARGQMPWQVLAPEMVYFLIISTALVRWYPLAEKERPKPVVEESEQEETPV